MAALFFSSISALAVCLGLASAVQQRTSVELAFDGPRLPPRLQASAMDEVTGIWTSYGINVRIRDRADAIDPDAVRLLVMVGSKADCSVAADALGSIPFVGDEPRPQIFLYSERIDALVRTAMLNQHSYNEWPTQLQEVIVGRVLGRALAHEIGHFLLHSRHHSPTGLMQAHQLLPLLIGADRQHFTLWPEDAARFTAGTR